MMRPGEEDEDFFAILEKEDEIPPQLVSHKTVEAADEASTQSASVTQQERPKSPEPAHHSLASESDHELLEPIPALPTEPDMLFEEHLTEFYSKHNFGNLDKVRYLADKFNFRRWELWEQLCIKYKLSPNEARLLFIKFNMSNEGMNECARKLFHGDEVISIPEDAMTQRKSAWRKLLGVVSDDSQRDLYLKYASELAPAEILAAINSDNNEIARDVYRTHQELALFREVWNIFNKLDIVFVGEH